MKMREISLEEAKKVRFGFELPENFMERGRASLEACLRFGQVSHWKWVRSERQL